MRISRGVEPSLPSAIEPDVEQNIPASRTPGVDLKVDGQGQRITFHISYTSAIVTCFAVGVIIALAYLIGRHIAHGPTQAVAGPSTEQLRRGNPRPGVLDVASGTSPSSSQQRPPTPREPDEAITAVPRNQSPPQSNPPPAPATQPEQRIIGRNYVVMQGYPTEEKDMALEACDLLNKNGIPCTIEKDLPGLMRGWVFVVGTTGFERLSYNPDYERYEKSIRTVSDKFPRNARFKKLDPLTYKWKG
ncbi:MAG TPA: hypothetical protein VH518_21625 [Tepidisphaeraceae bacterium]|jgi:hypothetical protein